MLLHQIDVLHRDVHPGNVGFVACNSPNELVTSPQIMKQALQAGCEPPQPVFIDYQWSTIDNFHPHRLQMPSMTMWPYLSDRVIQGEGSDGLCYLTFPH